jgi:anti-sigma factor RsiW
MTTMECEELVELVTAYLDDALDPEATQRVVDHLALCDGCTAFVSQVEATIRIARMSAPEPLDAATKTELLNALSREFGDG